MLRIGMTLLPALLAFANPAHALIEAAATALAFSYGAGEAGDEFRQSIDHAEAAGNRLLKYSDEIAHSRLIQLDEILNRTGADLISQGEEVGDRLLRDAATELRILEDEMMADLDRLVFEVECASKRWALADVKDLLGNLGEWLNTHTVKLDPPMGRKKEAGFLQDDPYTVELTTPFSRSYIKVIEILNESIGQEKINDDTPLYAIIATYDAMSDFSRKAACMEQAGAVDYLDESMKYYEKAWMWRDLVDPTMTLPQ